jgi:hypothetical protein
MSASWGNRMWEVTSVESFVVSAHAHTYTHSTSFHTYIHTYIHTHNTKQVGVKMRSDSQLTFRLKRFVPLTTYSGQVYIQAVQHIHTCIHICLSPSATLISYVFNIHPLTTINSYPRALVSLTISTLKSKTYIQIATQPSVKSSLQPVSVSVSVLIFHLFCIPNLNSPETGWECIIYCNIVMANA